MQVNYKRPDGSFVVTLNGLPYHVIQSDPLFSQIDPAGVPDEPQAPVPTEAERLADVRQAATLTRKAFCLKLLELSILPPDEASLAARGGWPATFASFTSGLTAQRKAEIEIDWAASTTIRYIAPVLQQLALVVAGNDQTQATALLDSIFGVQ